MTQPWQTRFEPKSHSRAAREEVADAFIEMGDALVTALAIHEQPAIAAYRRYSGYFPLRYSDHITGLERHQCHSDRDHGAARLIQIYSEQLRHMAPRHARESEPFANTNPHALSRVNRAATALYEHASSLHQLHRYHGQRYREKAEPVLATIREDLQEMRRALRNVRSADATEEQITTHCKGLLDVITHCHQHALAMLPSTKTSGRAS